MDSKAEPPHKTTGIWNQRLERLLALSVLCYALATSLPITVPWVVLIIGMVIFAALTVVRAREGQKLFAVPPLMLPLLAFAVVVTVSGAVNGGLKEAWASLMTCRSFLVYIWAYQAFHRDEQLRFNAVLCTLLMGAVSGLFGTYQQIFNYHPVGFKYLQGTGFLSGPMAFAGVMQMCSLLSLSILLTGQYRSFGKPFSMPFIFSLLTVASGLGITFAGERSAWMGALVGFLTLVALISLRMFASGIAALFVLGALAVSFVKVIQTRLMALVNWQQDVSVVTRFKMWQTAWDLFKEHPLLGVGVNRFPHVVVPEALVPGHQGYLDHAHSNYFHMLATTGIIGFASFLWLTLASLVLALRNCIGKHFQKPLTSICREGLSRAIALGILAGLVSLTVSGLAEFNFGTGQVRLTQWFLLATLAGSMSARRNPD